MKSMPGLMTPTTNSYPVGANSPAEAAKAMTDANNIKLQEINQMAAGSKKRKYWGGNNSLVTVPVIKPIYQEQNGNGTDIVSQQININKYSMQNAAWRVDDGKATKMGGSRRRYKKGGNPDWMWPCSSGGKRRTNRRKSRKNKKRTRRHSR